MNNFLARICILLTVLVVLLIGPPSASAQQEKPNLTAEEWVYNQVLLGRPADLAIRFPNPKDRNIRGSFLSRLLRDKNSQNISRCGINVSNAHVIDNVDLGYMEVQHQVILKNMTFDGNVSFCRAHLLKELWLSDNTFNSSVDFCGVKAENDLSLSRNTFHHGLDLSAATITGSLVLNGSTFLDKTSKINLSGAMVGKTFFLQGASFNGPVDMTNVMVGKSFFLQEASFNGPVDMRSMQVEKHLHGDKAQFLKPDETVNFDYMNIKGSAIIPDATFMGGASFANANIGGFFQVNKTKFNNPNKNISFDNMTIGRQLFLNKADFEGPATFAYIKVGQELSAPDIHFNNAAGLIEFGNIQVGEHAFFNGAVFNGPVNFGFAHFGKNLELGKAIFNNSAIFYSLRIGEQLKIDSASFAKGADFHDMNANDLYAADVRFTNPSEMADFNSMQIANYINFNQAIFSGPVNFSQTIVGRNFYAQGIQFTNPDKNVWLVKMKISGSLCMDQSVFSGPTDFTYTEIDSNFLLKNAAFTNKTQAVFFSNAEIGGNFFLDFSSFAGPVYLNSMHVGKGMYLINAKLANVVNFFNTDAQTIKFANITWPVEPGQVEPRNLKYEAIEINNEYSDGLKDYLDLLDRSDYSAETYTELQKAYEKLGYWGRADNIYLALKARERDKAISFGSIYLHWWWSWFLEIFALYGRSPIRPVLWFLLFIAFGDLIFRKQEKMTALVENPRPYHSFIYSLDLFLPFSRLGMAHDWTPLPKRRFAHIYAFILNLLGWILIPIAILAIARVLD